MLTDNIFKKINSNDQYEAICLIQKWRNDIYWCLSLFEDGILDGNFHLELGIETDPCIKINVMPRNASPYSQEMSNFLGDDLEITASLRYIHRNSIPFVFGMKVKPEQITYEVYPIAWGNRCRSLLRDFFRAHECPSYPSYPIFYGVDSKGNISAYCRLFSNSFNHQIQEELGTDITAYTVQHFKKPRNGQWTLGKTYLDIRPLTVNILDIILSRYSFFGYTYLYGGGDRLYGILGKEGVKYSFYTTLSLSIIELA